MLKKINLLLISLSFQAKWRERKKWKFINWNTFSTLLHQWQLLPTVSSACPSVSALAKMYYTEVYHYYCHPLQSLLFNDMICTEFYKFTMLSQTLHHFSDLWHIFCFLTQSFIYKKKLIWPTLSIQLRMPFFQQCMYVWTIYLWKVLENQWVARLSVKQFHHTMLSLAPDATRFTEHSHDWY
jgi:hypothetical protein